MNDQVLPTAVRGAVQADAEPKIYPERRVDTEQASLCLIGAAARAVLFGGLTAGSLDIGSASLINWASPLTILRAIAGGLLGPESFGMGARSAVLGLVLQWFMSCLIAAIYVTATYPVPALLRRWIWSGCAFGIPIYLVMNFVVVPLSAVGHRPTFTLASVVMNLIAMILFGLVIAYCAQRWMIFSAPGRTV